MPVTIILLLSRTGSHPRNYERRSCDRLKDHVIGRRARADERRGIPSAVARSNQVTSKSDAVTFINYRAMSVQRPGGPGPRPPVSFVWGLLC